MKFQVSNKRLCNKNKARFNQGIKGDTSQTLNPSLYKALESINRYRMRATITRSWLETALNY